MNNEIKRWIKAAGIRALKTFGQTFAGGLPTTAILLGDINWRLIFSTALVAALFSLATSLAGLPELGDNYGE